MGYVIYDKERGEAVGTIVYVWETLEAKEAFHANPSRYESRPGDVLPIAKVLEALEFPVANGG